MTRVLFVCLGNICRSPLAEGLFRSMVEKEGLDNQIFIDSCGTGNYHIGEQPDPRTLANARQNGIELNHKARQFSLSDLEDFDYIIPMDASNLENIHRLDSVERYSHKIRMMRDFDSDMPGADVPDPYHGGPTGFQNVYEIVWRSARRLLDTIIEEQDLR